MRTLATLVLSAWLVGCSTTPQLASLPRGQAMQISVHTVRDDADGIGIQNAALGSNTATGAGGGALAGGLWGLTCGPLAVLCVPLGAAMGAATGTAAGAVVGVTGALSGDKAERLRQRVSQVQIDHRLGADLLQQLQARAGRYWALDTPEPTMLVAVDLQPLQLMSTRDEQVRLAVRLLVSQRSRPGGVTAAVQQKSYEYLGPYAALNVWMDDGGDFITSSFNAASQQLAAQVIADLVAR